MTLEQASHWTLNSRTLPRSEMTLGNLSPLSERERIYDNWKFRNIKF